MCHQPTSFAHSLSVKCTQGSGSGHLHLNCFTERWQPLLQTYYYSSQCVAQGLCTIALTTWQGIACKNQAEQCAACAINHTLLKFHETIPFLYVLVACAETGPPVLRVCISPFLQIGEQGVVQLPSIFKIIRQPCARNEAYSRLYPLRPWPLCMVPPACEVGLTCSRL